MNENEQKARIEVFLHELTKLSDKYNIVIKGCGCCGSPWLEDLEYGESYDNLTIDKDGKYVIEG